MNIFKIQDNNLTEINLESISFENNYYFMVVQPQELYEVNNVFNFDIETIEECNSKKHDTKIEVYNDYNFCIFNEMKFVDNQIKNDELNIFYSKNYIVCVSKEPSIVINNILRQLNKEKSNIISNSSNVCNKIFYIILDSLFMMYFDSIIQLEKKVEAFEEEVLKNNIKSFLGRFIEIRRQVLKIVRYIIPLEHLIDIIKLNENKIINSDMMRYFNNLEIKFNKLDSNITSLRESVAYLREAYEAQVANQANNIMKIFTIVSAIFLPLTLLTGIFGMNFQYMPWLNRQTGFYELMIAMIAITIALIFVFKKKKWFE